MLKGIKNNIDKLVGFILGLHGILHIFEFGFAMYEEAYITASFAGLGAITMLYATYFMGGHIHHHNNKHHDKDDNSEEYNHKIENFSF